MGYFEMLMDQEERDGELVLIAQAMRLAAQASLSRRRRLPGAPPRKVYERFREEGDFNIRRDYFGDNPVYSDEMFRRRQRMPRKMFIRIHDALINHDEYWRHRPDATGRYGHSGLQKMFAAVNVLAYGKPADEVDNYVRMAESTAREAVKMFCSHVIEIFGSHYLRAPNESDIKRILAFNEARGFPGMLGSIDCMHWKWKNCPAAHKGMFTGRGKSASLILEAVATHDLWIWHAYFGLPGSLNDINVLHRSTVFHNFLHGRCPTVNFTVNGNSYDMGYYLADGIYPDWPAFVKAPSKTHDVRSGRFKVEQEAARKEIERTFGVIQSRWGIIRYSAFGWSRDELSDIMTTCIILHNMIIEAEGRELRAPNAFTAGAVLPQSSSLEASEADQRAAYISRKQKLYNQQKHMKLTQDLIQHMWNFIGERGEQMQTG